MKKQNKASVRRTIGAALCFVFILCLFVGCFQPSPGDDIEEPTERPTIDTYVVKNGVSPYKILIPKDANDDIAFAAKELRLFFEDATGVRLEIVDTCENTQGKYLSIGETEIKEASGMTLTYEELGADGYKIKTYGDAIVMCGYSDTATIYSVYGFLAAQFDLEIYSKDIWDILHTTNAKLVDLDITDVPDIPVRTGGISYGWYGTKEYMSRFRLHYMNEGWGLEVHTTFVVLPPAQYAEEHPDWYNSNVNQICMTNEAAKAQFVENLKKIILEMPDKSYFAIGQEDGGTNCTCSSCRALMDQYDGNHAAVNVLFANDVVRQVNEWAKTACPDRILEFVTLGYLFNQTPPVEKTADGTLIPWNGNNDLYLEENMGIMLCPISDHSSIPYMENPNTRPLFEGWAALTDKLYVWDYSCPFGDTLTPFDGFGFYKQNYMDYYEMGCQWVFEQGYMQSYAPNFHELRGYLISKLMWDTTLDQDELIYNFISHYYGPGWEYIYEFYNIWRMHLVELRDVGMESYPAMPNLQNWFEPSLFSKTYLDKCDALFAKALEENEKLKETDPELYEMYDDHIRSDRCMVRYLLLTIYPQYYDYQTYEAMINEFEDILSDKNITFVSERPEKTLQSTLAGWRETLSNK